MQENKQHQPALIFNPDGTIDPAQLAGMDPEAVARLTSPEFIAEAKKRIQLQMAKDRLQREIDRRARKTGRREDPSRRRTVPFRPAGSIAPDPKRRPEDVSGRQRKRLRRAASRLARAAQKGGR